MPWVGGEPSGGGVEQVEGGLLERTLRQDDAEHGGRVYGADGPCSVGEAAESAGPADGGRAWYKGVREKLGRVVLESAKLPDSDGGTAVTERERAVRLARETVGVTQVVDRLQVTK